MPLGVQQYRACKAVVKVFLSLICILSITPLDAILISSVDAMNDSSRMYGVMVSTKNEVAETAF